MIFTHYCGSEFIRESFIPDAANVLDVLALSRMNPLPQIRRYARATVGFIREDGIPGNKNAVPVSGLFANEFAPTEFASR
jgi:hypothetical protein